MSLSNVAAQLIHRNAHTLCKKKKLKAASLCLFWRLVGAHTGLTQVTSLALFFSVSFDDESSTQLEDRGKCGVRREKKNTTEERETQRWTGQSEWHGNKAVGLPLHSGTLTTTTTTTTKQHIGITHVYAN